jgi:hypothetical protein
MKVSTALTLAASGAILAFAVHGHLPYFNPNAAGWVLMLVGIAGLFMPPGTQRWIRERLIMRDGRYGPAAERTGRTYSRLLMPAGLLIHDGDEVPVAGSMIEEQIVQEP